MLAHTLLPLLIFKHSFIMIRFGIFEFFYFCFMSNKYYLFNTIKFYKISFLYEHNFFIDEKCSQRNLNTTPKVFHESISCFMKCLWNCISWNTRKKSFTVYPCIKRNLKLMNEMLWKKSFTVYPCLKRNLKVNEWNALKEKFHSVSLPYEKLKINESDISNVG